MLLRNRYYVKGKAVFEDYVSVWNVVAVMKMLKIEVGG